MHNKMYNIIHSIMCIPDCYLYMCDIYIYTHMYMYIYLCVYICLCRPNLNSFLFQNAYFVKIIIRGMRSLLKSVVKVTFIFNFLKKQMKFVFYCCRLRMHSVRAAFLLVTMVSGTSETVQERSGIFLTTQRCFP